MSQSLDMVNLRSDPRKRNSQSYASSQKPIFPWAIAANLSTPRSLTATDNR